MCPKIAFAIPGNDMISYRRPNIIKTSGLIQDIQLSNSSGT